jgi:hypothetical protein
MSPPLVLMESPLALFKRQEMPMSILAMVLFFGMVAGCLMLGSRLRYFRRSDHGSRQSAEHRFSLSQLFGLITCLAIMIGFARLHGVGIENDLKGDVVRLVVISSQLAIMALAGVWLGSGGRHHLFERLFVSACLAFVIPTVLMLFAPIRSEYEFFVAAFFAQALIVAIGLTTYRVVCRTLSRSNEGSTAVFDAGAATHELSTIDGSSSCDG